MRARLHLQIGKDLVEASLVRRGQTLWSGKAEFAGPNDLEGVIAHLAKQGSVPRRPAAARIALDFPLVQVRTLTGLPRVRESLLPDLVAQQSVRYFRRSGKPLVVAAKWLPGAQGQPRAARVAAVEEFTIEAIVKGCHAAGLDVEVITPVNVPAGLSLLAQYERGRRKAAGRGIQRRLAMLTLSLWLAGVAGFVVRFDRERRQIDRELASLEEPIQAFARARRELDAATRMVQVIEQAERNRARVLQQLAMITSPLPDSAYLTSITLSGSAGNMSGVAPQATQVLADLEKRSNHLRPRLTGPVTREAGQGATLERFTLAFDREPAR